MVCFTNVLICWIWNIKHFHQRIRWLHSWLIHWVTCILFIGSKYIAGSGVETPNIFERLKSEKHIEILSKYFSPHFSGREDFINNYDWISQKFKSDQIRIILERFDVKLWNQIHRPMMQSVQRFMKLIIINATNSKEDETALLAHLKLFRTLIACQQEEKLSQCISSIIHSVFDGGPIILLK